MSVETRGKLGLVWAHTWRVLRASLWNGAFYLVASGELLGESR